MKQKTISIIMVSLAMLSLTACQSATPESMSGGEVTVSMAPVCLFVGSILAIFIALGAALWYVLTHYRTLNPLWGKGLLVLFLAIISGAMFPLNFHTLFSSGQGLSIAVMLYALYRICGMVKGMTANPASQVALFFGGAMAGLVARYCIELGEVSNTENFTFPHLAIFCGVYLCIYGVAKKIEMPR